LFAESLQSKVDEYEKMEKNRSDRSNKDREYKKKIESLEKEIVKQRKAYDIV
jgi:hypothetical protein